VGSDKRIFKEFLESTFRISDREWDQLEHHFESQELSAGEYFVREGKICRHLGWIAEGVMRYTRFEESGEQTTCYFASETDFAGDPVSFDARKPSTMNIHAVTDCTLFTLSYEANQAMLKEVARYREVMAAIDRKTTMDLMQQRDWLINRDAASRYQYFIDQYPHILRRVPLGHIASFLDITPQSLSRLRKQTL